MAISDVLSLRCASLHEMAWPKSNAERAEHEE
jgi:hypothetical protein